MRSIITLYHGGFFHSLGVAVHTYALLLHKLHLRLREVFHCLKIRSLCNGHPGAAVSALTLVSCVQASWAWCGGGASVEFGGICRHTYMYPEVGSRCLVVCITRGGPRSEIRYWKHRPWICRCCEVAGYGGLRLKLSHGLPQVKPQQNHIRARSNGRGKKGGIRFGKNLCYQR